MYDFVTVDRMIQGYDTSTLNQTFGGMIASRLPGKNSSMFQSSGMHIVGVSGSLRQASINTGLLRAAQNVLPSGVSMEIADLGTLPLYNGDLDGLTQPEPVQILKAAIARGDGLLIACPEYNFSFTGVLKNALDWVSRPRNASPLFGMPVAMVGAGGRYGTVRAQLQLRQVFVELNALAMPKPEFLLGGAHDKFDTAGSLIDAGVEHELSTFLRSFFAWIERVKLAEKAVL